MFAIFDWIKLGKREVETGESFAFPTAASPTVTSPTLKAGVFFYVKGALSFFGDNIHAW